MDGFDKRDEELRKKEEELKRKQEEIEKKLRLIELNYGVKLDKLEKERKKKEEVSRKNSKSSRGEKVGFFSLIVAAVSYVLMGNENREKLKKEIKASGAKEKDFPDLSGYTCDENGKVYDEKGKFVKDLKNASRSCMMVS